MSLNAENSNVENDSNYYGLVIVGSGPPRAPLNWKPKPGATIPTFCWRVLTSRPKPSTATRKAST